MCEMSRLYTMSRFAEPDEKEPVVGCVQCETDLYEGDEVYNDDIDLFCSKDCVVAYYCGNVEILGDK